MKANDQSKFLGHTLEDLKLREQFGVSIVAIIRGDRKLVAPNRKETLMPFDRIIVLGTDAQLTSIERFLQAERHELALRMKLNLGWPC